MRANRREARAAFYYFKAISISSSYRSSLARRTLSGQEAEKVHFPCTEQTVPD
jgi:hypothetical protein